LLNIAPVKLNFRVFRITKMIQNLSINLATITLEHHLKDEK
jgi:hypothetical protein